ncbi:MAG: hypothetical protein ACTTKL_00120 [Treponema sp.]
MNGSKLRFCAAAAIFCAFSVSAYANSAEFERFFAELWRYEYSGASNYAGIERFSGVSNIPASAAAGTKWTFGRGAARIIGLYMEEYADIFDIPAALEENTGGGAEDFAELAADGALEVGIPEELTEMQKEIAQKTEDAETKPAPERRFTDIDGKLRFHSFEDETLSLQKTADGYTAARSGGNRGVRMFYDADFRLSKREFWDLSGGLETQAAVKTEKYAYEGGAKPVSAVVTETGSRTEIFYDEAGRIALSKIFAVGNDDGWNSVDTKEVGKEKDEKSAGDENQGKADGTGADTKDFDEEDFTLQSTTRFSYGEDGKLMERNYEAYTYRYGRLTDTQTRREVYEHKIADGEPDYYFYENGALRMKRIYGGVDTYTAYMYFDGGYSSESVYENGRRVRDLFFFYDKLVRSRNYE